MLQFYGKPNSKVIPEKYKALNSHIQLNAEFNKYSKLCTPKCPFPWEFPPVFEKDYLDCKLFEKLCSEAFIISMILGDGMVMLVVGQSDTLVQT